MDLKLTDFDYHLPEELIAQTPLIDRDGSRLLHLDPESGAVSHHQFRECVDLLRAGDVLVLNNTRVNAWRFLGTKQSGGKVEVLALKEVEPGIFECLLKPGKRLKAGATIMLGEGLSGEVLDGGGDGTRLVRMIAPIDLYATMEKAGTVPLPPYITAHLDNPERYQTVVASENGSAAAPTAGLHFTSEILRSLEEKGVKITHITLHVGIDTFRPIQVDNIATHTMHGEVCEISPLAADIINRRTGRLIAVGTTTVRTLESLATPTRTVKAGRMDTRIFIHPGYEFKVVEGMFTNFHLPKTTMLLMISALCSREKVLAAYEDAVDQRYQFLSFGDSMLILTSSTGLNPEE